MPRNIFTRFLRRGRRLFQGRRPTARIKAPSSLRLEWLEDRRLLASGFGSLLLVESLGQVSIEVSIQQSAVVRQQSAQTLNIQNEIFSPIGSLNLGIQSSTSASSATNSTVSTDSGGLLDSFLNPVTTTVGSLVRVTQPLTTTATTVVQSTLGLVPNLLTAVNQANPSPAPLPTSTLLNMPAPLTSNVSVSGRASAALSSGASSASATISTPNTQPSSDTPTAPQDVAPVIPPAAPDTAPQTPVMPGALNNPPAASRFAYSSLIVPPIIAQDGAAPVVNAETAVAPVANAAAPQQVNASDFNALWFGSNATAIPAANALLESQSAVVSVSQNMEEGRIDALFASTALSGADYAGWETYVFSDVTDQSSDARVLPALSEVPLSRGEQNDVSAPPATGETAPTLVGATDEVVTQVAVGTAESLTEAARNVLAPATDHWMRYVAPVFLAAGAFVASRLSRRRKTQERQKKVLALVR